MVAQDINIRFAEARSATEGETFVWKLHVWPSKGVVGATVRRWKCDARGFESTDLFGDEMKLAFRRAPRITQRIVDETAARCREFLHETMAKMPQWAASIDEDGRKFWQWQGAPIVARDPDRILSLLRIVNAEAANIQFAKG